MKLFDYTLWPNIDGKIGEKKIPIPDGVTVQWPDGDSLVGYFVYKNEKLTAFVDTKAFITNASNSTIFPYENVIIRVDGSLKGVVNFSGSERTKNLIIRYTSDDYFINTDIENGGNIGGGDIGGSGSGGGGNTGGDDNEGDDETGGSGNTGGTDTETIVLGTKYINCTTVAEMLAIDANCPTVDIVDGIWSESLANLTTCDYPSSHEPSIFDDNADLREFHSDLSRLQNGYPMFSNDINLEKFDVPYLNSLTDGTYMFLNCASLDSFSCEMYNIHVGYNMFNGCSSLSTFNSSLSSLEHGDYMFGGCESLYSFNEDCSPEYRNLSSLTNGYCMFHGCSSLPFFDSDLSSLRDGRNMFLDCSNLSTFNSNLQSLTSGYMMFSNCASLSSFNSNLDSLENGYYMFLGCNSLDAFNVNMPSLKHGDYMFERCSQLSSFDSNLDSLVYGDYMFRDCHNLSSFNANLGSLTRASGMFSNTILDASSIENIATTINTVSNNPNLDIGINSSIVTNNAVINNLKTIKSKGWNLKVYVNGEIFDYENTSNNLGIKYINCTTPDEMYEIDSTCPNNDIVDGVWNENLEKLTDCQSSHIYNYRNPFEGATNIITFNSDLSSLENGYGMFAAAVNLVEFNVPNLNSLTYAYRMFEDCSNLQSFDCDMLSLTDGTQMFYGCEKLSSFISNIEALTNGYSMFYNCTSLSTFTSDMNALTDGQLMFYNCTSLSTFTSDMNALLHCDNMFYDCSSLVTVESNMKSLKNGSRLFYYCYNLAAFSGELSSLTNGFLMFYYNNLSTFNETLTSLTNGNGMFSNCNNLTSFDSNLESLINGYNMFGNCFNLSSFTSNLGSLTDGCGMFQYCVLDAASIENIATTINTVSNNARLDLGINPSIVSNTNVKNNLDIIKSKGWNVYVNGNEYISEDVELGTTFINCKTIDDVKSISPNYKTEYIIDGVWNESLANLEDSNTNNIWDGGMFNGCTNLTSFTSDLSSLTDGIGMFNRCTSLSSFNAGLGSLTNGSGMFYGCENLTTFTNDLNSLAYGNDMFEDCTNLNTFASDLSSLTNGSWMFCDCDNLTTFTSDLRSLTNGWYMFEDCKLNTASIQNIAETIKDVNDLENKFACCDVWKFIDIGIENESPNTEEDDAFKQMVSKGWCVIVTGSSLNWSKCYSPESIETLEEFGEEFSSPIPFYAKPVQTSEEHAEYTDGEGNFFNILGGQFIYGDDISTYGMFSSLEDAAANMRLTKIEK